MLKRLGRLLQGIVEIKEQDSARMVIGKGLTRVAFNGFIIVGSVAVPLLVISGIAKVRKHDARNRGVC